jgi:cation-transporting ATPase E
LQVEVNWLVRVLLLLVALYGLMIALSLWVHDEVTLLQATQHTAVIIGLAPTGLFMMIVTAYALGAVRIAGKGALVQRINAVESLSNVTVLCLDKTGTLTSGRLALEGLYPLRGWRSRTGDQVSSEAELRRLLGVYASSGSARNATTDAITRECPGERLPVVEEAPFSSARKWSALVLDQGALRGAFVLGAPEVLCSALSPGADLPSADGYTVRGLRVLLFAHKPEGVLQYDESGKPRLPAGLAPLCYVTLRDELRPEARQTLEGFRQAGIAVKILSGDNPGTVAALARQAGLWGDAEPGKLISGEDLLPLDDADFGRAALENTIFGRITPDQKQGLVRSLRDQGKYVAMTGDGINDVLALKQAQVSIAMQSGSQAAREVADMVLLEDSFAALPHAFQEGQRILNGMEDILKLTLTHVFALAFLITTISMVVAGFPYTPSENGLLTILSITIPSLGLAIWARPGPMPGGRRLWRLNRFVVPAALTTGLACLTIYLFAYSATRDHAYAQTMLTYGKTVLGLMLVPFLAPPSRFWAAGNAFSGDWRPTVLALATLVLLAIIGQTGFMQQLFGLTPLSTPTDPLVILAVSVLWVLATRWLLRTRLVERYLGVDWETPRENR